MFGDLFNGKGIFDIIRGEKFGDSPILGGEASVDIYPTSNASPSVKFGQFLNNVTGATATNNFTSNENALARQYNSAEALAQFNRELNADSTKYQRTISDLEAAGLNPILAVQGLNPGSVTASSASAGASSGASGAGATIISAITRGISQIVSSAIRAVK